MTNYPDESSLRFNGFFFFNSRWDILHLFRGEHYWLFFIYDEYFLFWFSRRLSRHLHFWFSLWLRSCSGLGLSCGSGGASLTFFALFAFLLNSFRITPLDYMSHYLF